MLAVLCKTPELALSEEESKQVADAVSRVNDLYDLSVLSEEAMAWVNLAMVMGTVYGPRFLAVSIRKKREKAEEAEGHQPTTVAMFPAAVQ